MDWTQIILAVIATSGTIGTVVLPITLNRSHKKTRGLASEENKAIIDRIDGIDTAVADLRGEIKDTSLKTQGLYLLDVIEHRPHQWETIRGIFAAYQNSGGNGHIERVYRKWEEDYGAHYDAGEIPPLLMKAKRQKQTTT